MSAGAPDCEGLDAGVHLPFDRVTKDGRRGGTGEGEKEQTRALEKWRASGNGEEDKGARRRKDGKKGNRSKMAAFNTRLNSVWRAKT